MKLVESNGRAKSAEKVVCVCGEYFNRINFKFVCRRLGPAESTLLHRQTLMNNHILCHGAVHQCDLHPIRSFAMELGCSKSTTRREKKVLLIKFRINFSFLLGSRRARRDASSIFHRSLVSAAARWIESSIDLFAPKKNTKIN